MKKIVARAFCIASAALVGSVHAAVPESALVASAIASEVRTTNQSVISRKLEASRARLNERLRFGANDQIGGVIVFATGQSPKELAAFATAHGLEVTRAEAKVSAVNSEIVQTMSFGADVLFFLDGPLDERLEKLVGRQRGVFMAAARASDSSNAETFREAAYSRGILFYKIEAVGSAGSFDGIAKGADAAAILIDETNVRVEGLADQRRNAALMRGTGLVIKGRPYADGPPPEVGQDAVVRFFGAPAIGLPDPPAEQPKPSAR